jgi:cold-inducible RNA-binding protein
MNSRLYVGNLSFHTSQEALQEAFGQFGEVTEVRIVSDRETGRSRGFAFVSMADSHGASEAITRMDGTMLDGRSLRVNQAEDRQTRSDGGNRGGLQAGAWASRLRVFGRESKVYHTSARRCADRAVAVVLRVE